MMNFKLGSTTSLSILCCLFLGIQLHAGTVVGPMEEIISLSEVIKTTVVDTIPIEDRHGDFITDDYYNPFDILPSIIDQKVEYDFETGQYIVFEKIGDEYYRTPTYLTMTEYLAWQEKKQQSDYFKKLAGIKSKDFSRSLELDPMSEIDIDALLADRLFGGTDIDIKPTGNIDLNLGFNYFDNGNPNLTEDLQSQFNVPIFDMDINMGVEAKIGDKLDLGFNYNTQATFDFDNKLNLGYGSDLFDEDDIIKTIEAGNINFALPGELIQGQQNLFGLKTELQFGKFWLTAVASQSRSEKESITLENGKLIQDFEIYPDQYDENRHFFISHYFRQNFERALSQIPQVRSLVNITDIEVWVTNDQRNDLTNATSVAALEYLGESDLTVFADPQTRWTPNPPTNGRDVFGQTLPSNRNSDLFRELVNDDFTRQIDNIETSLKGAYGMTQSRDFERHNMRKLTKNEYTFHPQLGFISLNQRLRPNQVLGVAYEFTYTVNANEIYKVGEMTNESNRGGVGDENQIEPEDVIYVKMLKNTNQNPGIPSWDLMMKNVYPLNTSQLTQEDFQLDIFFEDNANSRLIRYIPEDGLRDVPLLELFGLDRLNNYSDPQEDGIFDFVPGVTVNSQTGSIIFPVLEPFGSSLRQLFDSRGLDANELVAKYGYPELYENTVTAAKFTPEKNRFRIKGQVKSNTSSEISLGTFNIPQGSVTVRAGSQILREGIDYDIDYGIGRIKILNESYLQQGVPIKVSFEDQGLFNLQQKTMFGLRGEMRFNENFTLGATYMRLFERPFTQKVNIGEDPINNRMFGLDLNFTTDAPGITRFVDRLPLISTDAPSTVTLSAEVAALKPGNSKAINAPDSDKGVVSLDDFEGANSGIPLGSRTNIWTLASPSGNERSDTSDFTQNTLSGVNRALVNWYVVDDRAIPNTNERQANSYSRRIEIDELFDREIDVNQLSDLRTFDVTYYPDQRGPYNFDTPDGIALGTKNGLREMSAGVDYNENTNEIVLKSPEDRWGGIMRYLPNNDFEASNYEYIEFWMLNPFMDTEDVEHDPDEKGLITFQLGNVSEDILRDNLQFYENAIATGDDVVPTKSTAWGNVPLSVPNVQGFDLEFQELQDLGFDGMNNDQEREKHADYVNLIENTFSTRLEDVANDDYLSYLDENLPEEISPLDRYKRFNHPEGNAPIRNQRVGLGNPIPDSEDLNENRSLETNEAYYEYVVDLTNSNGEIDRENSRYITDVRTTTNPVTRMEEKWYRFQIPIAPTPETTVVGDIEGFRSIQFLRTYFSGFKKQKTFRLAEYELVRNQWRRLELDESCTTTGSDVEFIVNEVGIQENGKKTPFRYVLPVGIKQERIFSQFSTIAQDENSLALNAVNIPDSCEMMISKLTRLDMRQFERVQMFVHGEEGRGQDLDDGDLAVFVRFGRDFINNYYEYEIPLVFSDSLEANKFVSVDSGFLDLQAYSDEVWKSQNFIDFPLTLFTDAKRARNNADFSRQDIFEMTGLNPDNLDATVKIKGNPTLGLVKGMVIGIRNTKQSGKPSVSAEVWVNELRLQGLNNRGGVAAKARMDIQLADFGNVTSSFNYSSIGWGQIDEQLQERSLEAITEFDVATNLELGKLFPSKWGMRVPFYYQYANSSSTPEYDPLELDLTKDQLLENPNLTDNERTDIVERQKDVTTISTFNFTNVRKERSSQGAPKPWDVSNFTASYSFSRTKHRDEIIKEEVTDDQRGELVYSYNAKSKPIQPFKGIKSKPLRFIKEINFNPVPNSFSFNTQLQRYKSSRLFRLPDPTEGFEYVFDDKRFNWNRNYALSWDLAKSLKLNYDASAIAVVDELKQVGVAPTAIERKWKDVMGNESPDENQPTYAQQINDDPGFANRYIRDNLADFGRLKNYTQGVSLSYTLPLKYFPGLDWISAQAQYNGDYSWSAASFTSFDQDGLTLGNIIQNTQKRTLRATLDFEKLYEKIGYFKRLEGKNRRASRRRGSTDEGDEEKKSNSGNASTIEKIFLRPLLSIRGVKFNYSEDMATIIPGYVKNPKFFGLTGSDPGWGFVLGAQPNLTSFLEERGERIITESSFQNQQIIQENAQTYEADIEIEPWKGFSIDVDFSKRYTQNHSEYYINVPTVVGADTTYAFDRLTQRDFGSYEISYMALNTLFDSDIDGLFQRFDLNRQVISARLPNNSTGAHQSDIGYTSGYGRQHVDVLIPAFIAAYTNQDPETVDLDFRETVSKRSYIPKPNWSVRYNGLSDISWFKELFSNISINHSYKTSLNVNSFQTDLQFDGSNAFQVDPLVSTGNYFARFEVPEVVIEERFEPIIGLDIKTKTDLTINADYSKSRSLRLATTLAQLTETRSTSYTVGLGWIFQNVNIGFLTGRKRNQRTKRKNQDPDNPENPESTDPLEKALEEGKTGLNRGGINEEANRLEFAFNLQYRDDVTLIHELGDGKSAEPTRGTRTFTLAPILNYDINKNFILSVFFDYSATTPYRSNQFPITQMNGGLKARFILD